MHLAWHSQGKLQEDSSRMGLHCQGRVVPEWDCTASISSSVLPVRHWRVLDKPLTTHLRGKYHPCSLQDRKIIAKSLKGVVCKVCQKENGHLVILGLFECVDDTVLIRKLILTVSYKVHTF